MLKLTCPKSTSHGHGIYGNHWELNPGLGMQILQPGLTGFTTTKPQTHLFNI